MFRLSGLFAPKNSLILVFDDFTPEKIPEFKEQLTEVGKYYRFAKLSQLAQADKSCRAQGLAAVVFESPRRSNFLQALPHLKDQSIPFTIFINPEYVGTNRLAFDDELKLYQRYFDLQPPSNLSQLFSDFEAQEALRRQWRIEMGPLPLNELDPQHFLSTWGQIADLPPALTEIGLTLYCHPGDPRLGQSLAFARVQLKRDIQVASTLQEFTSAAEFLKPLGLSALLIAQSGQVEKGTSPFALPRFQFESITN